MLDVIDDEGLVERSAAIGETMRSRMEVVAGALAEFGDVRGLGAMLAIELVEDPQTKVPATALAARVQEEALGRGLLLLRAGCPRELHPGARARS